MATRLRLQRRGRKNYPFYQIIVADSRAPRDGKYIERIGSYNPNTNPATITLDFERALHWLQTGAEPSDTVRNILSREGVLMKKHLLGGVTKGAFTEEEANRMTGELNGILGFVEQLSEVDVSGVEPMTSVIPMVMRKREDGVTDGNIAVDVVANAPATEDHFFLVPKVVE